MKKKKQAVLLIHGIGEQRPMDTLRGFVKAVWETDKEVHDDYAKLGTWSIPDTVSDSYELRCLTTSKNKKDVLTDFYEFYWAHLMEGNKISHVTSWLKRILFQAPWKLPKPLVGLWFFLFFSGLLVIYLLFNQALPGEAPINLKSWYSTVFGLILIPMILMVFEDIVGDAARYLDPSPKNIKRRQEIRAKGINVLKKLHDSGNYDRIIVVGHSLGTFIAYDILTHAWQHYNNGIIKTVTEENLPWLFEMEALLVAWNEYIDIPKDVKSKGLSKEEMKEKSNKIWPFIKDAKSANKTKLESLSDNINIDIYVKSIFTEKFRSLQFKVHQEQKEQLAHEKNAVNEKEEKWLVSDFITLGSPLTYSDLLLAKNKKDLMSKQDQKELPTVPPTGDNNKGINYRRKAKWGKVEKPGEENKTYLHYAAMFALTRWTNIYFPPSMTVFGDIISGPLQPLFGCGIKDVSTKTKILNGFASHTNYWSPEKRKDKKKDKEDDNYTYEVPHILALRKAMDLLNRDEVLEDKKEEA